MPIDQSGQGSFSITDLEITHSVAVNEANGSASVQVPIPVTGGRGGFGPGLQLNYRSGAANSTFGMGWGLSGLQTISLSTKSGLPKYDGSDQFAFNGNTELVPWLDGSGEPQVEDEGDHWVAYYREKFSGSKSRFEQWTHKTTRRTHWRIRSVDNIVSVLGAAADDTTRLVDPENDSRIYSWLLEAQYDPLGNVILYEYLAENDDNIDFSQSFERHRLAQAGNFAQRYLKRILYGNTKPFGPDDSEPTDNDWTLRVVFDYDDHSDPTTPDYTPDQSWTVREDPYSYYRTGFELRTYRLGRRILMFHKFDELGTDPLLVGAYKLTHNEAAAGSTLTEINFTGFRKDLSTGTVSSKTVPSLVLEYSDYSIEESMTPVQEASLENIPQGLDGNYRWLDLHGNGLPGILRETGSAWYYKENLGNGEFGTQSTVIQKPSHLPGAYSLSDFNRDGNLDLVIFHGRGAGYYSYDKKAEQWNGFRPFNTIIQPGNAGRHYKWLDLNGDGRSDLVITEQDRLIWYPSEGKNDFNSPIELAKQQAVAGQSSVALAEIASLEFMFADMTGDGLPDQVRVGNGRVEYWPNLGNGQFGAPVLMDNAPDLGYDFDPMRVRFADLDGSGTTDLLYIGRGEVKYWFNAAGNGFVAGNTLTGLPYIDQIGEVTILDLLANGTNCLVWSTSLPGDHFQPLQYLQLTSGVKPRLLSSIKNSMGKEIQLTYGYSASHYLRDQGTDQAWKTCSPTHAIVVDQLEVLDLISGGRSVSRYHYRNGSYNGDERSFTGFGQVDRFDSEIFTEDLGYERDDFTEPICHRTWYHNGQFGYDADRALQYYSGDADHLSPPHSAFEAGTTLAMGEFEEGFRILTGKVVRRESYPVNDDGNLGEHPFETSETSYQVRRVQEGVSKGYASYLVYQSEILAHQYEQAGDDPRVGHHLTLSVDDFGNTLSDASVAYPRRSAKSEGYAAQDTMTVSLHEVELDNITDLDHYQIGLAYEDKNYDLGGLTVGTDGILEWATLESEYASAVSNLKEFHQSLDTSPTSPQARLIGWSRSYFWNDDQTSVLPLGDFGSIVLNHHESVAVFSVDWVSDTYDTRVDDALLTGDGMYEKADSYWWQKGAIQHYSGSSGFYMQSKTEELDGGETEVGYDAYFIHAVSITNALSVSSSLEIDYQTMQPYKVTDPNGTVREMLFDPLGVAVVQTDLGSLDGQDYGFDLLVDYTERASADIATIVADPTHYLQEARTFFAYDLDAWQDSSSAPWGLLLSQIDLLHDGSGTPATLSDPKIGISYFDGYGRLLQSKTLADPGEAIERDSSDNLVLLSGEIQYTTVTERWLVSGHAVYNNKQQVVRSFEPFYSGIHAYESEEILHEFGVSTRNFFDAMGRSIKTEFPNGTFNKVEFTPWSVTNYDVNDTVEDSLYKTVRSALSTSDPEYIALTKTQDHASTPVVRIMDAQGLDIATLQEMADGSQLTSSSNLDAQGNVIETIDPRGITSFEYSHDMLARECYRNSADAGEAWFLEDAKGQAIRKWDGRDVLQKREYDLLGRVTAVYVDGAGLAQYTEKLIYGEDSSISNAASINAYGQLVKHYDQAGVTTYHSFSPGGNELSQTRQLAADYTVEPDWGTISSVSLESDTYDSSFTLDALDRIHTSELPDGTTRKIDFKLSGVIDAIKISTSDNVLVDETFFSDTEYNARGQLTRATLGNGVDLIYSYDSDTYRMTKIVARKIDGGTTTTYQSLEYTYDPVGNVLRIADGAQESTSSDVLSGLTIDAESSFTYDELYQIIEATGRVHQSLVQHDYRPGLTTTDWLKNTKHITLNNGASIETYTRTYEYDDSGNLKKITHSGTTSSWATEKWVSSTSNRSLPSKDASGVSLTNHEDKFDEVGNCTYLPHLEEFAWNYRNNLHYAKIIDRSGSGDPDDIEYYVYDASGMRTRKVTERYTGTDVEYTEKIYLNGCEIKRITVGTNQILERFTSHIHAGDQSICRLHQWTEDDLARETTNISDKKYHYLLSNHLGSSSLELDENANIISYEEYFPFGGTAFIAGDNTTEINLKDYRYSGKELDDATGLYYFGYRYYVPWLGNWLSPDPIGPEDGLNLYQYVHNNPVTFSDPLGLETFTMEKDGISYTFTDEIPEAFRANMSEEEIAAVESGESDFIYITYESEEKITPELMTINETKEEWLTGDGYINIVDVELFQALESGDAETAFRIAEYYFPDPGEGDGSGTGQGGNATDPPPDPNLAQNGKGKGATGTGTDAAGENGKPGGGAKSDGEPEGTGTGTTGAGLGKSGTGSLAGNQGDPSTGIPGGTGTGEGSENGKGKKGGKGTADKGGVDPGKGGDSRRDPEREVPEEVPPGGKSPNGTVDGEQGRGKSEGGTSRQRGGQEGGGKNGSPKGIKGSWGSKEEGQKVTALDQAVKVAGLLEFELGGGKGKEESGGLPGGSLGWFNPGPVGQVLYIGYVISQFIPLGMLASKLGRGIGRLARWGFGRARAMLPLLKGPVMRAWSGITGRIRNMLPTQGIRAYSRKLLDRARYVPPRAGIPIVLDDVLDMMKRTPIGREAIEALERRGTSIWLSTHTSPVELLNRLRGKNIHDFGFFDPQANRVVIYVNSTRNVRETAATLVHEAMHARGVMDSKVAEFLAEKEAANFLRQLDGQALMNAADMHVLRTNIAAAYASLPQKVNQVVNYVTKAGATIPYHF